MTKKEIIPIIIHHMLRFNQPFTKQELCSKLEEEGIVIENMHAMMEHFLHGETVIATGEKFSVNVKPLFG